jgi:hypothetical protein
MGCLNSTPSPSSESEAVTKSESIEITESQKLTNEKKRSNSNPKEDNYHVETVTANILQRKDSIPQDTSQDPTPAAPPAPPSAASPTPEPSPKQSKKQRDSLESNGEKKLKLSELLHAEKMKKSSGSVPLPPSSGEVSEQLS